MTLADLPEVMAVEQIASATPWPEASYRRELEHNHLAYFDVLRYQNKLIGYSGMWHFVDAVHLGTIVTHQNNRGQGIGELLLVNVIHRAMDLSANEVTLEVRESNIPASSLYSKYGFEVVGRRKQYYRNEEDAIIMTTPPLKSDSYLKLFISLVENLHKRLTNFYLK